MNLKHTILIVILCTITGFTTQAGKLKANSTISPIDRHALVTRHNIEWNDVNGQIPLGNGEFCFNADGTGLQTFGGNTMSHWAWHSFPLPEGITADQIPVTGTFQTGRNTGLDKFSSEKSSIRNWMYDNPHIYNLGRIRLFRTNGVEFETDQIKGLTRTMDLWYGILTSKFTIDNQSVQVTTCVNPDKDEVAIQIKSPLLESGQIGVAIDFPYPSIEKNKPWVGDFTRVKDNKTILIKKDKSGRIVYLSHEMDTTIYYSTISISKGSSLHFQTKDSPNTVFVKSNGASSLELTCAFSSNTNRSKLPDFDKTIAMCKTHWPKFWNSGGAIDLSESKDPRWKELERRIVLSQYETAVQSAGSLPPAEIGLMGTDSWRGQFHMEMIWWHLAHYALWNRWEMADKALSIYKRFIPTAKELSEQLGYKGLKWQKSACPEGRTAPWEGNQVLLWRQPHPIFFAELDYRLHPNRSTLKKWAEIIDGTAEHMADYPTLDEKTGIYHLDPVMPPSEQGLTKDDVFDLAYWTWGLNQAQIWRERMGLKRNNHWDKVINNLAPLPIDSGLYMHSSEWTDTYTKRNWEHPNPVGIIGMLPPQKNVDIETAHQSLLKVWDTWKWRTCWGWDFPWTAMSAARLGEPEIAIDALMLKAGKKNDYDERGVCTGGPCPYLPGNGGLLYTVAMMAAGWDGAPNRNAPGFPDDGSWTVKWEGLKPAL